ncbi:MAG: sigma-70 family RNA polymerase sigma factor, partial [Planctomycetota bacterium]
AMSHPTAELATHERWLRTVLAARGVDRSALDETLQEVLAAAIGGWDRLKEEDKRGPWLYQIAVRQAQQYRRRMGRRRKLLVRYAESGMCDEEAHAADPLAWLLAEEQQQLVRKAIARLPEADAELLLLKYSEDWSYRQLAEQLGASVTAIEARLHRARKRLRSALAQLSPDLIPT